MCTTPSRNDLLHHLSTTPPRGINIIINNNNNQYHSGVTNTPSHPYSPSPNSHIDHTNRNHHCMDLSSLSPVSPLHHPPSQLYTLHCTTLCMSHTNSFFPNHRLPCSISKSSSSSSSSKQRCLSVSHTALHCTACTPVFHSSHQPTSSHTPPQQQLPTTGPAISTTVSIDEHSPVDRLSRTHRSKTMNSATCLREHTSLPSEDDAFKQ